MFRPLTIALALTTSTIPPAAVPTSLGAQIGAGQAPLRYEIAFPNAEHHEARI